MKMKYPTENPTRMRLTRNALALLPALLLMANVSSPVIKNEITALQLEVNVSKTLPSFVDCYSEWNLTSAGLSQEAFTDAVKGYNYLQSKQLLNNTGVLTIVDYSKPSSQKRLYVLDMNTGKILFNTLVAHGRNSVLEYATNFSNKEESHQTS